MGVFSKSHSKGDEDILGETCTQQLSLKVEKSSSPREGNTSLKVITSNLRSSPHWATLLAFWPFYIYGDRKPLLTDSPHWTWMRWLVLMKKSDYGLGSGSHGSFVLDFIRARLSPTAYAKFGRDFWHDIDPEGRNLSSFLHKFPNAQCMKKTGSIIKKSLILWVCRPENAPTEAVEQACYTNMSTSPLPFLRFPLQLSQGRYFFTEGLQVKEAGMPQERFKLVTANWFMQASLGVSMCYFLSSRRRGNEMKRL